MAKDPSKDSGPSGEPDEPQKRNEPQGGDAVDGEFVSLEGPDVETPTGGTGDAGSGGEGLSPEDLSFLEDVSAGAATETAPTPVAEDEHLLDLKRITAEYANYRRRTEATRQLERERAVGDVAKHLLPVLDDLDRAEKHGDLAEGGPLTTIAAKLRATVERIGVSGYGETGEPFDPAHHEAIFHKPNPEVSAATVADVVERGYRIGEVTLRVAKVVVDTPTD
ncbi:MAG: protein GrpE [Naasia sp.]|nr:protein GrpE [Naasia sp.]